MSSQREEDANKAKSPVDGGRNQAGWDVLWQRGKTAWDNGVHQPALDELFARSDVQIPRGRALVPGCGTGYDVAFLAERGFSATGLDVSNTAVEVARKRFAGVKNVEFEAADFFKYEAPKPLALCYDYTFLCAMPPEKRDEVGATYAKLLPKGGFLVALIFPIDGDRSGGPPYSMSLDIWKQILGEHFELEVDFQPAKAAGSLGGKELKVEQQRMSLWRRQ